MKNARSVTAPMKFFINKGLFENLPEYTKTLGKKPYIITDPFIYDRTVETVGEAYEESEIVEFGGESSRSEIERNQEGIEKQGQILL